MWLRGEGVVQERDMLRTLFAKGPRTFYRTAYLKITSEMQGKWVSEKAKSWSTVVSCISKLYRNDTMTEHRNNSGWIKMTACVYLYTVEYCSESSHGQIMRKLLLNYEKTIPPGRSLRRCYYSHCWTGLTVWGEKMRNLKYNVLNSSTVWIFKATSKT